MATFVDIDLPDDDDTLIDAALARLAAAFPEWIPREGHLEVAILEEMARLVAEARRVAAQVPAAIFREYGRKLNGLPPRDAAPATIQTTWTMVDDAGYRVTAGTLIGYQATGSDIILFQVDETFEVLVGQTVATDVTCSAFEAGEAANGVPDATPLVTVDSLAFVASIVSSSPSAGGVDAEGDEDYLNRLAQVLALQSPRPILPEDFAVLAAQVDGVHRATTIDGYNPNDLTDDNERMITVVPVDEAGAEVPAMVNTAVEEYLEGLREVNFVVHTDAPTFVAVAVDFEVVVNAGENTVAVRDAAIQTVADYLDPGKWGGGAESPPVWRLEKTVRYLEVAALLDRVPGVGYVASLTINAAAADLVMAGVAPLPDPTVTGTAILP